MLKEFREEQVAFQASIRESIREVLERVEDNQKNLSILEPLVGNTFANVQATQDSLGRQVKEVHDDVHADMGQLFNEIGTLQKAQHLPFLKPRRGSMLEGYRAREFETQTDGGDAREFGTQTDIIQTINPEPTRQRKRKETQRVKAAVKHSTTKAAGDAPTSSNVLLADDATKKRRMREQLIKPQYNVANFYYDRGFAQYIAKSHIFESFTLFVILFNAVWIAVEADHNNEPLIVDSPLVFQIVENFFCAFFTLELLIRYMAFRRSIYCLKDFWFVFDFALVLGMILETWVLSVVVLATGLAHNGGGVGNLSLLRMARLVKVCRMARMARLLRSVPELVMIVKGMGVAFRSVSFFGLLAVMILYVFSVALRQLTKDSEVGDQHFPSVPRSMGYLLLDGMLPIYAPIIKEVSADKPYLWPVMLLFVLLASVTVLNMLVGVLTEVVRTVASAEKEAMTVIHVTQQLRKVMFEFKHGRGDSIGELNRSSTRKLGSGRMSVIPIGSLPAWNASRTEDLGNVSKQEFEDFLLKADVGKILRDVGVDVSALLDMIDLIFEDEHKAVEGLTFADFVDIVLNLRGSNPATVKDIKEMLRIVKTEVGDARSHLHKQLQKEIGDFRADMADQLVRMNNKDSDSESSLCSRPSIAVRQRRSSQDRSSQHDTTVSKTCSPVRCGSSSIYLSEDDVSEVGD